ncbi:cytochrome b-245 heavy chain-like [Liolophura sinensis]|uniref:cytochrome b-245 heavy chain-like n=1 Tax=Liolophura sinensis TaxID=3198878 RepID=UPI0031597B06
MGSWLLNEGPKWLILVVWLTIDVVIFTLAFIRFDKNPEFELLRLFTGSALAFARASAASLNYQCMLILLPVCRNLISFLRGSCKCCKRNVTRQFDKNLTFHKCVAYAICFHTVVHVAAHCFNFELFILGHDSPDVNNTALLSALSSLRDRTLEDGTKNETFINPIISGTTEGSLELWKFISGVTGAVITLCLIVMVSSATEVIRRSYFEVFWFTHHLFVIFFIGLVLHGIEGIVRSQTNEPVCKEFKKWGQANCPQPQFGTLGANTWKWVVGPVAIYIIERLIRIIRNFQKVTITKVIKRPSNVIELQMKKEGFRSQPGQYVFLKCPQISWLEWHPFTLTSSPDEDHVTVHIRCAGDWTRALATACTEGVGDGVQQASKLPSIAIDGPFGTAAEDIFRYQVDVMVAAGIGVTPFASVLKHIWYKYCDPSHEMKLRKVYFYWICPDPMAFEWIQDLLQSLEVQMAEQGKTGFLIYNIYLTRGWDKDQAAHVALRHEEEHDPITGLQQKTYFGRPNWDQVFASLAQEHTGTSVGVFFCGPKVLSNTLHTMCNKYSSADPTGAATRFFYNKENF